MKKIKQLYDHIEEELEDAEDYIDEAVLCRDHDTETADLYCRLAEEEMGHVAMIHKQVVRIIEEYRKVHGPPPADMQARYDLLHEIQIKRSQRVRLKIQLYKEG